MAGKWSARSVSRAAEKNSPSTCGVSGHGAGASGLFASGAVRPATKLSRIYRRREGSSGNSTSTAASRSIPPAILNSGSSLACLRTISGNPSTWSPPPSRMVPVLRRLITRTPSRVPGRAQAVIAAALTAATIAISAPACADPLGVGAFGQLALRCGPSVAPSTLASIARTESAFEPLSINDNTTGANGAPATRDIVMQIASKLIEAGHSVDIGIMQINSANFARLGLTLEAAFDPCKSVAAGAAVLAGGYAGGKTHEGQQSALRVAISKYNTGDAQRGFTNGYVHKVELAAGRIVPALDVGAAPAAIDSRPLPMAAPSAPVDPNAPPSWDVWSSFDYAATHHQDTHSPAPSSLGTGSAVLADAGGGPTAAVTVSGPAVER